MCVIPESKHKLLDRSQLARHKHSEDIRLKPIPDLDSLVPEWTDTDFLKNFESGTSARNGAAKTDIMDESIKQSLLFRTLDDELKQIISQIRNGPNEKREIDRERDEKKAKEEAEPRQKGSDQERRHQKTSSTRCDEQSAISRLISKAAHNIARNTTKNDMESIKQNLAKIDIGSAIGNISRERVKDAVKPVSEDPAKKKVAKKPSEKKEKKVALQPSDDKEKRVVNQASEKKEKRNQKPVTTQRDQSKKKSVLEEPVQECHTKAAESLIQKQIRNVEIESYKSQPIQEDQKPTRSVCSIQQKPEVQVGEEKKKSETPEMIQVQVTHRTKESFDLKSFEIDSKHLKEEVDLGDSNPVALVVQSETINQKVPEPFQAKKSRQSAKPYSQTQEPVLAQLKTVIPALSQTRIVKPKKKSFRDVYRQTASAIAEKSKITRLATKLKYLRKTVTAASFLVYDLKTQKTLVSAAHKTRREMASLTKVATFYTVHEFMNKHQLDLSTTLFEVSAKAASMKGTSAKLTKGIHMSVRDLLYGLMLPSGNDAALCLAENVGRLIRIARGDDLSPRILNGNCRYPDSHLFADLMNSAREQLGMKESFFMNPHGLNNPKNFSTCQDLMLMCEAALKMGLFRRVVGSKEHHPVYYKKRRIGIPKKDSFKNLRKVDLGSVRASRHQTPNNSARNVTLSAPQNQAERPDPDYKIISGSQVHLVSTQPSCADLTESVRRVTFRGRVQFLSDKIPLARRFEFDFSKKSTKSILKVKKKEAHARMSIKDMYGSGQYLVSRRRSRRKRKFSEMGSLKSKKQFQDQMQSIFISQVRGKGALADQLSAELEGVLQPKLIKSSRRHSRVQPKRRERRRRMSNQSLDRATPRRSLNERPRPKRGSQQRTPHPNPMSMKFCQNLSNRAIKTRMRASSRSASLNTSLVKSKEDQSASEPGTINDPQVCQVQDALSQPEKPSRSAKAKKEDADQVKRKVQKLKQLHLPTMTEIYKILVEKEAFAYDKQVSQSRKWTNSNTLLFKSVCYRGIKTGNTPNAKYCLASLYGLDDRELVTSRCFEWMEGNRQSSCGRRPKRSVSQILKSWSILSRAIFPI